MVHSKQETLEKLYKNSSTKLYQKQVVNRKGTTPDGVYYNEILAKEILAQETSNNASFLKLQIYPKKVVKTGFIYKRGKEEPEKGSEKALCHHWLINKEFDNQKVAKVLGKPIEYELNVVKKTKVNVDLVSFNKTTGIIYLIEVKGKVAKSSKTYKTSETLLRCVLEIETYYRSLGKDFLNNFKKETIKKGIDISGAKKVKKAILVPEESFIEQQIKGLPIKDLPVYPKFEESEVHKLLEFYKDFEILFFSNENRGW